MIEAYQQFRPFDMGSFDLIEPLRAFRYIFYSGWIAKRWEDPVFPDAFPHFGSEGYWQNETSDLAEQLDLICESGGAWEGEDEGGRSAENDSEGELTNKDFFWDL